MTDAERARDELFSRVIIYECGADQRCRLAEALDRALDDFEAAVRAEGVERGRAEERERCLEVARERVRFWLKVRHREFPGRGWDERDEGCRLESQHLLSALAPEEGGEDGQ